MLNTDTNSGQREDSIPQKINLSCFQRLSLLSVSFIWLSTPLAFVVFLFICGKLDSKSDRTNLKVFQSSTAKEICGQLKATQKMRERTILECEGRGGRRERQTKCFVLADKATGSGHTIWHEGKLVQGGTRTWYACTNDTIITGQIQMLEQTGSAMAIKGEWLNRFGFCDDLRAKTGPMMPLSNFDSILLPVPGLRVSLFCFLGWFSLCLKVDAPSINTTSLVFVHEYRVQKRWRTKEGTRWVMMYFGVQQSVKKDALRHRLEH